MKPRYPVYVPSKGRFETGHTLRMLAKDGVEHYVVVEPQEAKEYSLHYPAAHVLELPRSNAGLLFARNWIRDHAEASGTAKHWQLDDNITECWRWHHVRIPCSSGIALRVVEDFVDRYENVGIAGLEYEMFAIPSHQSLPPYRVNVKVYSISLVNHAMPCRWRIPRNDDTDLCLQAIAGGWNTVCVVAFCARKLRTMTVKGGNTQSLYQGDGRLRMARDLERLWPGVVKTKRRFGRPQHWINWSKLYSPLRRRSDVDWKAMPEIDNYGLHLAQVAEEVKSLRISSMLAQFGKDKANGP